MIQDQQRARGASQPASAARPVKPAGRAVMMAACLFAVAALFGASPALAIPSPALKAGAADLRAGQIDAAITQLTKAIDDPTLSARDTATAFYYRGLAYRKVGQPTKAIADLGAAIWLGLPTTARITALVHQGYAFQNLGLNSDAQHQFKLALTAAPHEARKLMAEKGKIPDVVTSGSTHYGSWWDNITSIGTDITHFRMRPKSNPTPAPAPAQTPVATAETKGKAKQQGVSGWSISVEQADQAVAERAAADAQERATKTQKHGAAHPTPAQIAIAEAHQDSAPAAATAPAPEPSKSGNRFSRWLPWGHHATPAPAPQPAPATETATASNGWSTKTQAEPGLYALQLPASHSEQEAMALWHKVVRANPALSHKTPHIEKAEIGGLGTFYRLRIGPFHDRAESAKLCDALKRSGIDCALVTVR